MPIVLRYQTVNQKLRHICGWRRGKRDHRDLLFRTSPGALLPAAIDLRTLAPKVEDQGDIGSCTCNSSTTAMEIALAREGIVIQLSRLWPYAKVREYEGTPLQEDSGAEIRDVVKIFSLMGCPSEKSYPYDSSKFNVDPGDAYNAEAAKYRAAFYYRCPDLFTLKASLAQGWPVIFGFQVPENMMSAECAKTGIVRFPGPIEGFVGGHAVLAMGYDDQVGCVLSLNSWGIGWGDGGYFWLPYDFFLQNLADDFWTIRRTT